MTEHRHLSVGDALVVIALLAFIVGWMAFLTRNLGDSAEDTQQASDNVKSIAAVLYIAMIAGPAFWAAHLVSRIVKGHDE